MSGAETRELKRPSGHVFRVDGARGAVWFAKYRLPNGRQLKKRLGPAAPERGRPPAGYFTKRVAEDWLRDTLDEARRHALPGMVATGATFADAASELTRYAEDDRGCKPSTLHDYRSRINAHLLPAFGTRRIDEISSRDVERWRARIVATTGGPLTNKSNDNLLVLLHGIFRRAMTVYGLPHNPIDVAERHRVRPTGDIDVLSSEEGGIGGRGRAGDSPAGRLAAG
jgi:integrase